MPALREDAPLTSVFGVQVYTYGLYVAIGLALAVIALALLGRRLRLRPGTTAAQAALSLAFGLVLSRLLYGLLDETLGYVTPAWAMLRLSYGGYSLYGALAGACVAAALAAMLTKEKTARCLDALAPAFLLFTACERLGEQCIESFGLSRGLTLQFFCQPWLSAVDEYDTWFLMTWRVEFVIALILCAVLTGMLLRPHRDSHVFLSYMLLFGATQIIMESLRYDGHMTVRSFVRMEQILSMVLLGTAVIYLAARCWKKRRRLALAGVISIPLVTGCAVAIEFMIDRTDISRLLLYLVFIALVAVPVVFGFQMLREDRT